MSRKIALGIIIFFALSICVAATILVQVYGVLPQSAYALFGNVPAVKSTDKILVVSPHQDDETIGAGGLMVQAFKAGATVRIVFATDGNKHGIGDTRHEEAIQVASKLGVPEKDITFFGYPDGDLANQNSFQAMLGEYIKNYQPTIVITTLPEDTHPDHAACGRAVQQIWQTDHSFQPYYFLVHNRRYPKPSGYEPEDYLLPPLKMLNTNYIWETLPLTDSQRNTKYLALLEYRSQISYKNPILRELIFAFVRQNELFAIPRQ